MCFTDALVHEFITDESVYMFSYTPIILVH